jgi:WD40 repeat protein
MPAARILSLAWHCDDELLYSGGADSTIRRWNVKTGQVQAPLAPATEIAAK